MARTPVTFAMLVSFCLMFAGCSSVDRSARPAPAPKAPEAAAQARGAQVVVKMPAKEWRQVVNPADPGAIAFEHQQTQAVVTVQLFPTTQRSIEDVAGELFTRLSANGLDVDSPEMSPDKATFGFRGKLNGEPFEGRMTVKRMPGRPAEASFFAMGVWPKKFDEKMAKDYEAIVGSVAVIEVP